MEIIDEDDEEIKQLMLRISRKEITLCDSCDAFFDYIPQKAFCDECVKEREREYRQLPEIKEQKREYDRKHSQLPEVKEKKREYNRKRSQRPEVKERQREYMRKYRQRPEVKERRNKRQRERYHRLKELREEE